MKLLIQSDDYGITRAQAAGAIYGIKEGLIRNTGMFVNMPWSNECFEWIVPYLDKIAFGIDLNASTGNSVLGYHRVPSLCHEDGSFLSSSENRALDTEENNYDHIVYEDLYAEFDAQIKLFVEMTGMLPDYFHGHAYLTKTTHKVISDLSRNYNRPYSIEFMNELGCGGYAKMSWVQMGDASNQIQSNLKEYLLNDKAGLLEKEIGYLVTHCGYCDVELMNISSFNLVRIKDLEALCSHEVKQWIEDNKVELITFKDLYKG